MNTFTLSGAQRSALRKALTASPLWPGYRAKHNLSIATMKPADLLAAADALGVNWGDTDDDLSDLLEVTEPIPNVAVTPDLMAHIDAIVDKRIELALERILTQLRAKVNAI
jgi:hypothetical protein